MKPTSNFKMSKTVKRMLSLFPFKSNESRTHFKKHMILSQLTSEQALHTSVKGMKEADPA